jgi:hypothetical protein
MTMNPADPFAELAARDSAPSDRVLASLREDLKKDEEPRRALTRGQRVALSAAALIVGLSLTSVNALVHTPQVFVIAAAAFSLSVGGLLLAGAVPGGAGGFGVSARKTLFAVLAILGFTTLAFQAESFLSMTAFLEEESARHATKCAGHSLLSGVVGSSVLMFLWRRTDPFSPGLTGALLGLLGGALGTLSVGMLCSSGEGLHLTLGHGLSLLLLAGLGVFCGRKWLTP